MGRAWNDGLGDLRYGGFDLSRKDSASSFAFQFSADNEIRSQVPCAPTFNQVKERQLFDFLTEDNTSKQTIQIQKHHCARYPRLHKKEPTTAPPPRFCSNDGDFPAADDSSA